MPTLPLPQSPGEHPLPITCSEIMHVAVIVTWLAVNNVTPVTRLTAAISLPPLGSRRTEQEPYKTDQTLQSKQLVQGLPFAHRTNLVHRLLFWNCSKQPGRLRRSRKYARTKSRPPHQHQSGTWHNNLLMDSTISIMTTTHITRFCKLWIHSGY